MLELIKAYDMKGVCYRKKYRYGFFILNVIVNLDGSSQFEAKDEINEEIKILAIDDNPATMYVENAFLYNEITISAFVTKMNQAKELFLIMENEREMLKRKE